MSPTRRRRITILTLITLQKTIATNTNEQFIGNTRKRKLLRGQQHNEQQYKDERSLQVTDEYIQTHPWYPEQHIQKCLLSSKSKPPPNWMINTGGYAEQHLFSSGIECCTKWFPEDDGDTSCLEHVSQIEKEEKEQSINEELSSWVNTQHIPIQNEDDDDIKPYLHDMLLPPQRPQVQSNLGRPKDESSLSTLGISPLVEQQSPEQQETVITLSVEEEPIIRGDKTEVLGIPPLPTPPVSSPSTSSSNNNNNESPYTISTSTFGPLSVASEACSPSCPSGSTCVGNSASGQLIQDEECEACAEGQTWWPCDVPGLCWCHTDGTDRIAPAPPSGIPIEPQLDTYYTVCDDILTKEMFETIAPNANEPYTYEGLCDAILSYNAQHTEKAFGMGNVYQRTAELAAFIGNTLHESDEYKAPREYLMCADNIVKNGEVYCKPCDPGSFDWSTKKCGHSLVSGNSDFNEYCQPQSMPPEACSCGVGAGEGGDLDGYVAAKHLFFGRGAIQLSWNYNYIGASVALTGSPDTFCTDPDIVAREGKYVWGVGIFFWMEHTKEGTTSHIESLRDGGDFGGTLNNINGGLECPAHGGWHVDAVKARLDRYCRAAKAFELPNLMRLDNCAGLQEALDTCLVEGKCNSCQHYAGKFNGEVVNNFVPPSYSSSVQVDTVEAPICPEGLMPWEGNSDCCVPNSAFVGDGACDPEAPYNTAVCGYDGGDCCQSTCNEESPFGCKTKEGGVYHDYGPFGFYCIDPAQGDSVINSISCDVDDKYRLADGKCNPSLNTPECNFDGGDCCEETCSDTFGFYPCGSGMQSFDCLDPRFRAVDTNSPSNKPTRAPTQSPQQDILVQQETSPPVSESEPATSICPEDMLECPDGTFVSRDRHDNCAFYPCPEECDDIQKECLDGSFRGKDPYNGCKYLPCREDGEIFGDSLASSINSALDMKYNYEATDGEQPITQLSQTCDDDLRECNGGSFVARDPKNNCQFQPCSSTDDEKPMSALASSISSSFGNANTRPEMSSLAASITSSFAQNSQSDEDDKEEEPMISLAASITSSFEARDTPAVGTSMAARVHSKHNTVVAQDDGEMKALADEWHCPTDVFICSDGRMVGRDHHNNCKFIDCQETEEDTNKLKQALTTHSVSSHHKKKNSS